MAVALVELADTLADEFDLVEFLHTLTGHAVRLLQAGAATVVLLDPRR